MSHLDNECLIFYHHTLQRLQHVPLLSLHNLPLCFHDLDKFSEVRMLLKGVGEIKISWLEQIFQLSHHGQIWQNLNIEIHLMGHVMLSHHVKNMFFFHLKYHSSVTTLQKEGPIDTKTNEPCGCLLFGANPFVAWRIEQS